MRKTTILAAMLAIFISLAMPACGGREPTVGLKVDVYLHPDSADDADVLLQAAIRQRLAENTETGRSLIHVRVFQKTVFLSGTVKSGVAARAEEIAKATSVSVNGQVISPDPNVRNRLQEKR